MISKNIDEIIEADLLTLIENQVLEGKSLDYKEKIEIGPDGERKEFLADVSSFANASGGMIIYGISEQKGVPKALEGIDDKPDETILKLEGLIRDGVNPRIIGIKTRAIPLSNTKNAIIISIPKSYNAPHQVIFKDSDKFYSRASNGKYKLDVGELRVAFNLSETYVEKIKRFKQERLGKIIEGRFPISLPATGKMVLHFVPLLALSSNPKYDLKPIIKNSSMFRSLGYQQHGMSIKYVFEGCMAYYSSNDGMAKNYTLLFRNGIIEMVNTSNMGSVIDNDKLIPSILYEQTIIDGLKNALNIFKSLNMDLPILAFCSLVDLRDYKFGIDKFGFHRNEHPPFSEQDLLLPEILIENYDINVEQVLRDWFDSVWNAAGFERSFNYDESGKWRAYR